MIDLIYLAVFLCWVFLVYTWICYPAILCALALENRRSQKKLNPLSFPNDESIPFPSVSILLSAYNEEKQIDERIKNLLDLDYPKSKIDIWIGVDRSEDLTLNICEGWSKRENRINVLEFTFRRGKIAILKALVEESKSAILIFTDANTFFKSDAIKKLVSHFKNPSIDGVCGRLVFIGEKEENVYWRFENRLKEMESFLDSCLGANGAIYAIRRNLFWSEIPDNTIVDDFVIGLKVREQGGRFVYEPQAVAEENLPSTEDEWGRRTRIGAGDYQSIFFCYTCLFPKYKKFAWIFWSHKVLRWFTPHVFVVLFAASIFVLCHSDLSGGLVYLNISNFLAGISTSILLIISVNAILIRVLKDCPFVEQRFFRFMRLVDHFFTMQAALIGGFIRFCRGDLKGYWSRTSRN